MRVLLRQRKSVSLKLSKKGKEPADGISERFPLILRGQIKAIKAMKNTKKATKWATNTFASWLKQRNEKLEGSDRCPDYILLSDDHSALCHWLCVCVNKLRKEGGKPYTPRSLANLIASLQRYICEQKQAPVRLAHPENAAYKPLHRTLDSIYCKLHTEGTGTKRKQAEIVTAEEEEQLWGSGAIGTDSPVALANALFYLQRLNFVLRGGSKHHGLKISQLNFRSVPDPDLPGLFMECVEYTEHRSPFLHYLVGLEH